MTFEWDENKNQIIIQKHGVSFEETKGAFLDMHRIIIVDEKHSRSEKRYFLYRENQKWNCNGEVYHSC